MKAGVRKGWDGERSEGRRNDERDERKERNDQRNDHRNDARSGRRKARRMDERAGRQAGRRERGLTLFELLVGLSIVALLSTLAVPGFAGLKRSAGMSSAANELLWALQWARSSAGMHGSPITVCLTQDDRTCIGTPDAAAVGWLVFEAGAVAASAGASPPAVILQAFHLPADVTVTATRPAVTFWPVARAGMTSTFELCDISSRTSGRSIVISQTGRPRVSPEPASCAR